MTPCPHARHLHHLPCPYRCHAGTTASRLLLNNALWDKRTDGVLRWWVSVG